MSYVYIVLIVLGFTIILTAFLYQFININKNMERQVRVLVQLVQIIQKINKG